MGLKNGMEMIVEQVFTDIFLKNRTLVCSCKKCKTDIMALALNRLPPKYVASSVGNVYIKLLLEDQQLVSDVLRELTRAAGQVEQKPLHEAVER